MHLLTPFCSPICSLLIWTLFMTPLEDWADQWFHWKGFSGAIRRWAHLPLGGLTCYPQWPRLPLHLYFVFPLNFLPFLFVLSLSLSPPLYLSLSLSLSFLSSVSRCWEQYVIFRSRLLRSSHLAPVATVLSLRPVDKQTQLSAHIHTQKDTH